ncbi:MAG TPA: SMP-30/gluconolactonase/LRE family protein [Terriglobales bacterium]|jgi:D-xylonolactonase|nr:SMP-30/gluconolactonase/LRE family protein [Terriglobales bacterium]
MPVCTVIVDDENLCGESPIWDAPQQKLYWTDCSGSRFYSYDWKSQARTLILSDFEVNGCALDQRGGFTFINNSGVWSWDRKDRPALIVSEFGGEKLQLNDCIADPEGRLLAGSCFYNPAKSYPLGKLFSIEDNGQVRILDEGFHLANGLGFSPDGTILYATDSVARTIYAYAYDSTSGRVGKRRVFAQADRSAGLPDGLTVDAEGYIWSAEWYGSCISRYFPDGKLERRIETPAKQTSSLAFGGPELRDIFVTSAARSEPMPVMPPGYDPINGYFGGALVHLNIGIQGRVEYRTRLG